MEIPDKPQLIFYQKMTELFYAIAATDKVVRNDEYQSLKKIVEAQWKDLDVYKDSFCTDAVSQIEVVFNWFDYEQLDAKNFLKTLQIIKMNIQNFLTKSEKN